MNGRDKNEESESDSPSIFDLFEPPPEPDPSTFGKVPVVRGDDEDFDRRSGTTAAERKTAAEAEAAGLQHWTAPATGQIPAVLANEAKGNDLWGDVKGPSWQSDDPTWSGPDLADVFAGSHDTDISDDGGEAESPSDAAAADRASMATPVAAAEPAAPEPQSAEPPAPKPSAAEPTAPEPQSAKPVTATEPRRSELDDWGPGGRPLPPNDTSEGRRIPGMEPPARLDTTEISSLRRPAVDLTVEAPRRSSEVPTRNGPGSLFDDPDPRAGVGDDRPSVTLERSMEAPEPPGLRRRPAPETATGRGLRPRPPESRPEWATASEHLSDADPTAPGLYGDGGEDRYFADDAGHDDRFLDAERPGGRNLPLAIATGVILAGLVLAALWVGPEAMMVIVTAAAVLGAIELYNAMRLAGLHPATLLGLLGTAALPVAAFFRGDAAFTLVAAMLVVFGVLWYLAGADNERPVLNLSLTMLGVLWIGGLGAFAALILRNDDFGIPLLLSTITIAVTSDTMAYFGGRAFGRRPFHSVSPNKTWEGTMTGFVFAVFVSFAMAVMPFTTMWDGRLLSALLLGAVIGVLTPIGDLAESLVKRDLGVKDMGTIVPGHGGILDRVDGILFALPGAYYVALLIGIF